MKQFLKNLASYLFRLVPLFVVTWLVKYRINTIPWYPVIGQYLAEWEGRVFPEADKAMRAALEKAEINADSIRTAKPIIFAMIGLPQTGKTTVATAFAKACGAVVADNNAFRVYLQERKIYGYPRVNEVAFAMASIAIGKGYNIVLDSDFANPIKQRMLEAFAASVGARVQYLRVGCSKASWQGRMQSPDYKFGMLYYQAVWREMPSDMFGIDVDQVIRTRVQLCVEGEYARQEYDHKRPLPEGTIEFLTSASRSVVEHQAATSAWKILSFEGSSRPIRTGFHSMIERQWV